MTCDHCHIPLSSVRAGQKYCSHACRRAVERDRRRESERLAAAARVRPPRTCLFCEQTYTPGPRNPKYCSKSCSTRSWDKRQPPREPVVVTLTCPGCGTDFVKANNRHTHCTARCSERERDRVRAAARRAERPVRTCVDCLGVVDAKHGAAVRCRACAVLRKQTQDRVRVKQPDVTLVCGACSVSFVRKNGRQTFCSVSCQKKASYRRTQDLLAAAQAQAAKARTCRECDVSIADRGATAVRCYECASARSRGHRTDSAVSRANKVAVAKSSLKRRDPPKKEAPKPKPKPDMPNLSGDWFPGWDGCWSPSLGASGRALVEKWIGPGPEPRTEEVAA